MKHIIITIFCCILGKVCFAQINQYDKPSYGSLSLPSFSEMATAAAMQAQAQAWTQAQVQAHYEQRERYLNSLVEYISDALTKNIDSLLEKELLDIYSTVKTFYKKPLANALVYSDLKQQGLKIKDAVIRYNTRLLKIRRQQGFEEDENGQITKDQAKNTPSSGTGFFLSKEGYIVTNYHVIADARTLYVTGIRGDYNTTYSASVEQVDSYNDLAIIKISDKKFTPFTYIPYIRRQDQAEIGENCYVLGYPLISTMGVDVKLTNGIVSARTGFHGDVSQYQISAPVQPGNSGGPLFDSKGNIIGVVSAKHAGAENAGYAIKMSYLQNLIDLLPVKVSNPSTNILTGKPFPDQVKIAKDYVCIILANVVQEPSVIKQAADSVNTETIKQDTTSTIMHNSAVSTIGLTSEIKKDSTEKKIISPVFVDKQYSTTTDITSIEITPEHTIINMRTINTHAQDGWCNIDIWTYITAGKKKYRIISSKGIPRKPKKYYFNSVGEILEFSLIFPSIPQDVDMINLIEGPKSEWQFFGIHLK